MTLYITKMEDLNKHYSRKLHVLMVHKRKELGYSIYAHLDNGTGHRPVTIMASLVTSGLVRYEAVLHSFGTSTVGDGC